MVIAMSRTADDTTKLRPAVGLDQFVSPRGGSNSWAQREDLISAFRSGDMFAVPPLTVEYAPILACNAACPLCPYTPTRRKTLGGGIVPLGEVAVEDDVRASTTRTAFRVIDAAHEAGANGVLITGGGEPTIWPSLFEALHHCAQLGLQTAIYTNGLELARQADLAARLLHPHAGLVFARISINAASEPATRVHWGMDLPVFQLQLEGLTRLLRAREDLSPLYASRTVPSIQVSTVVDKHNVCDLEQIVEAVSRVFAQFPKVRGEDDTLIVRPLTMHGRTKYSVSEHSDDTITRIISVAGPSGSGLSRTREGGLRLFLGFGLNRVAAGEFRTYGELLSAEYANRSTSLASGAFLTVGPDATVYPCTERNCDPAWAMGNLKEQSVRQIYTGSRRRKILAKYEALSWGPEISQPTPRTARLDHIAQAIFSNTLTEEMIAHIRALSLYSHRLLLD